MEEDSSFSSGASPSSSSSSGQGSTWTYDVYFNFGRKDTSKNFVEYLYSALVQKGINVFKDDEGGLVSGEIIGNQLARAIEGSRFAVVVFSKGYASSRWCLDELVKIMERKKTVGQIILPVYYHVAPSDVRTLRGSFRQAFTEYETDGYSDSERVHLWKEVLREAADLPGWAVHGHGGDAVRCITEIVDTIMAKLRRNAAVDVFLSFRGEDTRGNIVDHLYTALDQKGIYTFKDDKRLAKGKSIAPELLKTIEGSSIAVVVFSKRYADSSWCLDELAKIRDSKNAIGQIVFPVFYHVEPSDVKKQQGSFGEGFKVHNKTEKVEVWRQALEEIGSITGWHYKSDSYEAEHVKQIVQDISSNLRRITSTVDENLIGIVPRVLNVKSVLGIGSNDVRMIGILGMGGAGKTTIARSVFNQVSAQFEGACFVENVREVSNKHDLQRVQKEVISKILMEENLQIYSLFEGTEMIKKRLRRKKVVIVLDDLDHISQLEALVGSPDWFGEGSRILITTRDKHLLQSHGVNRIYNVDLFTEKEAIQLLSRHAFKNIDRTEEHWRPLLRVVRYADGLPFALKVLGSFLCDRDIKEWTSALDKLQTIPDNEIQEKLKISYNGLEDIYKETFLHIACFFNGWEKDMVFRILDSCELCPNIALKVLEQKSLISISSERVQMHDLMQEMGRHIVRKTYPDEPERHSRLWRPEEVLDVLMENKGTEAIKAILLCNVHNVNVVNITESFTSMKKLRLLHANAETVKFQGPSCLPNELRWLTWDFCALDSLPDSFQANKLVGLEMRHSSIVQLWKGTEIKHLRNLKFLDISYSKELVRTPDFGVIPNLERLDLGFCSSLVEVHESIGGLKSLVYLNLRCCTKLEYFPSSMQTERLEFVDLSGCSKLTEIPEFICNEQESG